MSTYAPAFEISTDEPTFRILDIVSDADSLSKLRVDQFTDLFMKQ